MALIAQLGEHCTGIAEVVGSNPAQSLNFFQVSVLVVFNGRTCINYRYKFKCFTIFWSIHSSDNRVETVVELERMCQIKFLVLFQGLNRRISGADHKARYTSPRSRVPRFTLWPANQPFLQAKMVGESRRLASGLKSTILFSLKVFMTRPH